MSRESGIYKIIIKGKYYIGSALNIEKRLRLHINALLSGKHYNIHLQRAFDKYGKLKNTTFAVLEFIEDKKQLIIKEQYYIDALNPHYNIAPTAGSQLGFKHSDATKRKLSEVQMGKIISPEAKKNMSKAKMGKKYTPEAKKNMALAKMGHKNPFYKAGMRHPQFGTHRSDITKKRISETAKLNGSHKGEKNSASKSGTLKNIITNRIYHFKSLKPLATSLGLNYNGLTSALYTNRLYFGIWEVIYAHS